MKILHVFKRSFPESIGGDNLDVNSKKFHEFFNTKYELSWNRRAYNIKIFYDSEQETGGLTFNIYSFNFDGIGTKF